MARIKMISEKIGLIIDNKKTYILNKSIRFIVLGMKTFDYAGVVKNSKNLA